MGFLAPWFLGGLLGIGLPIYVHLLKKHKTVPLPFSSLMFFERRTQSSVKHRRLQYLLLFALRTLLILLLVLAFARPFVRSTVIAAAQGGRTLALCIDNSFSMREGDRLARAKADALKVIDSMHSGDRAQVISFGSQTHLLTEITKDGSALKSAVQGIEPSDTASSYGELVREIRVLATANKGLEAHLFSDMQKSSMPAAFSDLRLPDGVKLIPHADAAKSLPNFTVENVNAPPHIYDPKKTRVQATIAGFGAPPAKIKATLYLNGKPLDSKMVDVPAEGRGTVEFLSLEAPYGVSRAEVRIASGDAFPADDHFYFSTERSDPRPALFIHDARGARSLLYFRTALESGNEPAFTLQSATPEQAANLPLEKYAFVVLSGVSVPRPLADNLRSYVNKGGSVLVTLGREAGRVRNVPVSELPVVGTRYETSEGDRFQSAASLDTLHPAFQHAGRWDGIKFFQSVMVDPGQARVAARLSDNSPLLIDQSLGEGHILVFTSALDNIANDLPLNAAFVPFVEQVSHYLGNLGTRPANYTAGSYFDLRSAKDPGGSVEVRDPKGERALSLSEATRAKGLTLESEGFYDIRRPGGRHELAAVNPDRKESNLEVLPPDTLQLWQNTGVAPSSPGGAGGPSESPETKTDFWWYVMVVALALAIAESVLGNRHLAVDKEAA